MNTAITVIGCVVIILVTIAARYHLQRHVFNMPTDYDRFRSWRYRRAIRHELRRNMKARRYNR